MIIYSKSTKLANSAIGKYENPIKMIIEHESDLMAKKGGVCDWLFNVEKSNRYGETIITQSDFDIFQATPEGRGAEIDYVRDTYSVFVEHIQFMKEFVITAEMMEDAHNGIAADAKRRIQNFVRAYYKTINKICTNALASATEKTMQFAKTTVSIRTGDGLPLFSRVHKWGDSSRGGNQSNYFWGNIFSYGDADARVYDTKVFEEALTELSFKLRSLKDETGEPLGYAADTIILPGNRPMAEIIAKKVCGTMSGVGSGFNDINLNYGNWNIVILPSWQTTDDRCLIMSSEANKNLSGNMFFNRIPLTVNNWVDNHTGNYIWNGRCRFGIGFGSYKHILCAVDSATAISGATAL